MNELSNEKQFLAMENHSLRQTIQEINEKNIQEKKKTSSMKDFESHRIIAFSNELNSYLQSFNIFKVK